MKKQRLFVGCEHFSLRLFKRPSLVLLSHSTFFFFAATLLDFFFVDALVFTHRFELSFHT